MNEIGKLNISGTEYTIKDTVTSINSKTGEIAASDIATVLTAAGYALTDTNTWPTYTSLLTNDSGYITSSGSCNYANSAGNADTVDGYHLLWTNTWGISDSYIFPNSGLRIQQTNDESSGIQFNGDYINLWSPCDGNYSLRYFDEDDGSEVWNISSSGHFSGSAASANYATSAGSAPASDVYSWAKLSSKPSYDYSEINYSVNATTSAGGSLSLNGSTYPLHVITLNSAAVSSLSLSANPDAGHSCHIIFVNSTSSDLTVDIAYDATNRVTPDAGTLTLTVPASNAGYAEVDFINVNDKIYVRGVGK